MKNLNNFISEKLKITKKNINIKELPFEEYAISFIDIYIDNKYEWFGELYYDDNRVGIWFVLERHLEMLILPSIELQSKDLSHKYVFIKDSNGQDFISRLFKRFKDELNYELVEFDVCNDLSLYDIWVNSIKLVNQYRKNEIKSFEELYKEFKEEC
mgnify:FL=1